MHSQKYTLTVNKLFSEGEIHSHKDKHYAYRFHLSSIYVLKAVFWWHIWHF